MKLFTLTLATSLAASVAAVPAITAQTAAPAPVSTAAAPTPSTTPTVTGKEIQERKENQQDRIDQGLKSGELTAGEAAKLETQEAGINKEEAGMRAQDNGKLTTQDKQTLNAQQNVESKDIYADKHNDATQKAANGEVNDRLENQQDRIAKGLSSDKLTDSQAAKLETQEAGINKEETGMREQDNGKLTSQDKKDLNHQLNEESRKIQRDERRTQHKK